MSVKYIKKEIKLVVVVVEELGRLCTVYLTFTTVFLLSLFICTLTDEVIVTMVRLAMTTNSSGRRNNQNRECSSPTSGHTYSSSTHHPSQHYTISRTSHIHTVINASSFQEHDSVSETDSGPHYSTSNPLASNISESSHGLTFNPDVQPEDQPQSSGWAQRGHRLIRDTSNSIYQKVCEEKDSAHEMSVEAKYKREGRWCPTCHNPIVAGVTHHCVIESPPHPHTSSRAPVSLPNVQMPLQSHGVEDNIYNVNEGGTSGCIVSHMPNLLPISRNTIHPTIVSSEVVRQGIVVENPGVVKSRIISPSRVKHCNMEAGGNKGQEIIPEKGSCIERLSSGPWSGSERNVLDECESWETPTSLISRLTAGLTARSTQQHHACPSPSPSEESDASSFFYQKEPELCDDPFLMAHQELMGDSCKSDFYPTSNSGHQPRPDQKYTIQEPVRERSRKYTGSESVSSDPVCLDTSICGSQGSDMEDSRSSYRYPDVNYQPADLKSLLKTIRIPSLSPYSPDKEKMREFLEPEDIGHINHMIKSLSDAILTIGLPETLYKDKGFTPLDFMDIHLNAVIRQFFFVFKNEDFLNLLVSDQIALLNACSLRSVCCSSLYLFNQDSGCWHIPGATSNLNQPVIHISDLLQVYPQHYVTKMCELHTAAAKLDFDWPIGVIMNWILMYTPINKMVQEMDKIDILRNKYVHLLLKYISWKHGQDNASLMFPEMLKILDAVGFLVDELSTLTLNLSEDEILAVEERLSTLTLIQMAPLKCQSDIFKEAMASWSNLDCINLVDIHNRLCMALQISMLDSFQPNSTAEFWASGNTYFPSNPVRDRNTSLHRRNIPQLMPASEKHAVRDSQNFISHRIARQSCEPSKISSDLEEKDLILLRRFLEDVTGREGTMLLENIREKIDANQIQMVIRKLCS
ncbi:hypothetical protein Pmani_016283 [Petrolisthes manimaculis]|uniref:NR LBD domain-containing protein n=1 Tax=Petrolisthes manimaculis TaxID=1843537 RepID=A0AAE1U6V2_9EUCA|nr:hypothetical protein Pmani_016283 [Petrolisthes manimaculis]